jgi:hypothetical protein
MIEHNPVIRDRIERYQLVPSFPEFMGGLDHPDSLLSDIQFNIPDLDRKTAVMLRDCDESFLFDVKYQWISEMVSDDSSSQLIRDALRRALNIFQELTPGDDGVGSYEPLLTYTEAKIVNRSDYVGWAEYHRDLRSVKESLGLFNLDEIILKISNAYRLLLMLHDDSTAEINPLIKLRNRRQFLISKTSESDADPHEFMWKDLRTIQWRLQKSFQGRVTLIDDFLDILGLDDLPLISCPVRLSPVGVD